MLQFGASLRSVNYDRNMFIIQATDLSWRRYRNVRTRADCTFQTDQGILKGEVSLYHLPPVWLVWNQLYDNWQFLFLFAKQTNPNQSSRRSTVQWYFTLLVFLGQNPFLWHFLQQSLQFETSHQLAPPLLIQWQNLEATFCLFTHF